VLIKGGPFEKGPPFSFSFLMNLLPVCQKLLGANRCFGPLPIIPSAFRLKTSMPTGSPWMILQISLIRGMRSLFFPEVRVGFQTKIGW